MYERYITNKGEENYAELASKCNLIFAFLQISCNIIDIIYLKNTPNFPQTKKLLKYN